MMFNENETCLRLVADNTVPSTPLATIVEDYAQELYERRQQLLLDLAYFESKLADLAQLDPLDFTGLGTIYRQHAQHIQSLLDGIDENQG